MLPVSNTLTGSNSSFAFWVKGSVSFVETVSSGLGVGSVVVVVVTVVSRVVVVVVVVTVVVSAVVGSGVVVVVVVGAGVVVVVVVGAGVVVGATQGSPSAIHSGDSPNSQQTGALLGHTLPPHIVVVKSHSASLAVHLT